MNRENKMKPLLIALALLVASFPGAAADEGLGHDAEKLLDSALRTARGSRIRDRQKEKLLEEAGELSDDDLRAVVEALRKSDDDGKSLPEVKELLEGACIRRLWGEEAAKRLPDLFDRLAKTGITERLDLLAGALLLEDLRLAHRLAVADAAAGEPELRARAAVAIGCLLVWGETGDDLTAALGKLLADPDAAVRAVTIRAGFDARWDPVVPFAIAHLDDGESGLLEIDGEAKKLRPGEMALEQLREASQVEVDATWDQFHVLDAEKKTAVAELFGAWWEGKGKAFPPPGAREAAFRPTPSERATKVLDRGETMGSFQFWSGLDRTRIRLSVEEIELFATGLYDWELHFQARYMAQGMRSDDGEAYVRHHSVRSPWVLARKAIGCYVLTFQPLFEQRLKIRLEFFDPLR